MHGKKVELRRKDRRERLGKSRANRKINKLCMTIHRLISRFSKKFKKFIKSRPNKSFSNLKI